MPRSIAKPIVQAKLTVNTPGDIYEQEADAMADRVMRMSSNESVKPVTGLIGKSLQRKCAQCEEEEKKKKPVMRKMDAGNSGTSVSSSFASSLNASKGGGSPLPQGTRIFMENAFSTDFSSVKIHTGNVASEMSKGINANAFTFGKDIYFKSGGYSPNTYSGKNLLAHELTHVVQQTGSKQVKKENDTTDVPTIKSAVGDISISRQPIDAGVPDEPLIIDAGRPIEDDDMLNCMEGIERTTPARTAKTPYEICKENLGYEGPELTLTEDDSRQISEGEIVSSQDLDNYAKALETYKALVEGGQVPATDKKDIDIWINLCQTLLAPYVEPAVEAVGGSKDLGVMYGGMVTAGATQAAAASTAVETTAAVTSTAAQRAALAWGVEAVTVPAAATTAATSATTGLAVAEGGAAAAGATAIAPVVLTVAAIVLAIYIIYKIWDWSNTLTDPVRTRPEIPRTIRDTTDKINRLRDRLKTKPTPKPLPDTMPKTDKDDKRRKVKIYPICWPNLLPFDWGIAAMGPLPMAMVTKTKPPDRDFSGENQKVLQERYQRERKGDIPWGKMHVHHILPLFLGGYDDLRGNGMLLESRIHLRGHDWLRNQEQLRGKGVSVDLYDHPNGRRYYIAGEKTTEKGTCNNAPIIEL